jgi:hypothetical protein
MSNNSGRLYLFRLRYLQKFVNFSQKILLFPHL